MPQMNETILLWVLDPYSGDSQSGRDPAAGHTTARTPMNEVLHPGVVGVARGRRAVGPALVVLEQIAAPVAVVSCNLFMIPEDVTMPRISSPYEKNQGDFAFFRSAR